ncbi:TRAP transporter substrate-binding protein DctP [Gracilibacillus kekensis]|uniref:Tripartite ATP-independent transporter solute receptor, DctP family n=1 Tax=Gracilibacillus kekensis TaxID=1027249 RepID=A0A1M7KG94_9BACI|nr:TRAP transporter substrate-binding protein DctP [Gracilibacillus kekensis]SHM64336.1 tripartite ATP-independent transporter solute receptor, DctP family [Gracilibacillus kekensis]
MLALGLVLAACGGDSSEEEETTDEGSEGGEEASGDFEEQEWLFITEETGEQVQMAYADEFAKIIDEKSGGNITVTTYEYGGLGTEKDQIVQLQEGTVQLAVTSPGFIGNTIKESQIFGLHFLFPDSVEKTHEILTESEAINEDLVKQYEAIGVKPLSFWTEGAMQWTSNKPLESPADFENFKMRTQGSDLQNESYQAYGANPDGYSWGELYTALENGTMEGQENPIFFIADASFHEVQDYMTLSNHNNYVASTTVNQEWYEGLTEDERALVDETVDELQSWVFEEQKRQNDEYLSVIEETTEIIELTEEQRAEFEKLATPIRDYYRENISTVDGAILDKLEQEIEEMTAE